MPGNTIAYSSDGVRNTITKNIGGVRNSVTCNIGEGREHHAVAVLFHCHHYVLIIHAVLSEHLSRKHQPSQ